MCTEQTVTRGVWLSLHTRSLSLHTQSLVQEPWGQLDLLLRPPRPRSEARGGEAQQKTLTLVLTPTTSSFDRVFITGLPKDQLSSRSDMERDLMQVVTVLLRHRVEGDAEYPSGARGHGGVYHIRPEDTVVFTTSVVASSNLTHILQPVNFSKSASNTLALYSYFSLHSWKRTNRVIPILILFIHILNDNLIREGRCA